MRPCRDEPEPLSVFVFRGRASEVGTTCPRSVRETSLHIRLPRASACSPTRLLSAGRTARRVGPGRVEPSRLEKREVESGFTGHDINTTTLRKDNRRIYDYAKNSDGTRGFSFGSRRRRRRCRWAKRGPASEPARKRPGGRVFSSLETFPIWLALPQRLSGVRSGRSRVEDSLAADWTVVKITSASRCMTGKH